MKNKLVLIIVSMLLVIVLILGAALLLWNFFDKKNAKDVSGDPAQTAVTEVKTKKMSSSEIKDLTYEIKDITTNLADKDRIIRVTLVFQLDSKKTKDEFTNLEFKVKSIVLQTLTDMTSEQVKGSKGQDTIASALMNKINMNVLTQGKVTNISITDIIVQ